MDRFKEPAAPIMAGICAYCDEWLYAGDDVTRLESGGIVHDGCESDYVNREYIALRGTLSREGSVI